MQKRKGLRQDGVPGKGGLEKGEMGLGVLRHWGRNVSVCVCVDKGEKGAYIRDGLRVRQRLSGSSAGG